MQTTAITIEFDTDADRPTITFEGREAWALGELIDAGERGVTPIERPAPRWSGYIHKLRRAGLAIETEPEPHSGAYPGHHGRYVLRSPVRVLLRVGRE